MRVPSQSSPPQSQSSVCHLRNCVPVFQIPDPERREISVVALGSNQAIRRRR
ncbi:unnamed protein product [Rhodiola kirilowii]